MAKLHYENEGHIAKISIIALHLFQILHLFTVSQGVFNFATCGINSMQRYYFFIIFTTF
jgi:hypothetical protein